MLTMEKQHKNIFTLAFLSLALANANAGCPSKCTCSEAVVNCTSAFLESIPNFETLDVAPTSIDLSVNEIIYIQSTDFSFDGSSKVQYLDLDDNSILDINENAFLEMTELKEITLAKNLLESVPPMLIEQNQNLLLLDLSGNYFDVNNLELHSNSLEVLDLSSSKISSFTEENIKYLPNLKILNLRFNNLKSIEPSVFDKPNLLFVDLYYNMWECSQKTIDLFNFVLKRNLTEIIEPITCVTDDGNTYKNIYTRDGPVDIDSLNLDDLNEVEGQPKDNGDYYDMKDEPELTWQPYPVDMDLDPKQLLDDYDEDEEVKTEERSSQEDENGETIAEDENEEEEEEDTQEDVEEEQDTPEEQKEDREEQEDEEEQEEPEYEEEKKEREEQDEQEIVEQEQEEQEEQEKHEEQKKLEKLAEQKEENEIEKQVEEEIQAEEGQGTPQLQNEEDELQEVQPDNEELSESNKTDPSSIEIAIIREQHYFLLYQPEMTESDQQEYQYYFTNNLAYLVGVTAFVLTFLFGIFVGLCAMNNKFSRKSWRRRDMSASTSTLISKLSYDAVNV